MHPADSASASGPAPQSGPAAPLLAGRYERVRTLGRGAMGEVLDVRDVRSGQRYALKRIPPEVARQAGQMQAVRANFLLVSGLTHPHIAVTRFLEADASGEVFILMDLVRGQDLQSWLIEQRKKLGEPKAPLALEVAIGIAEQAAAALDYAHSQPIYADDGSIAGHGVLHRDLKPANLMVVEGREFRPGVPYVQLVDFGVAAEIQASMSSRTQAVENVNGLTGTPLYMAPEQWQGRTLTRAIDQWALAAMIYEIAEGRTPFASPSLVALRRRVLEQEPRPPQTLSRSEWEALAPAFSKDRTKRYPSCTALVQALAAARLGSSISRAAAGGAPFPMGLASTGGAADLATAPDARLRLHPAAAPASAPLPGGPLGAVLPIAPGVWGSAAGPPFSGISAAPAWPSIAAAAVPAPPAVADPAPPQAALAEALGLQPLERIETERIDESFYETDPKVDPDDSPAAASRPWPLRLWAAARKHPLFAGLVAAEVLAFLWVGLTAFGPRHPAAGPPPVAAASGTAGQAASSPTASAPRPAAGAASPPRGPATSRTAAPTQVAAGGTRNTASPAPNVPAGFPPAGLLPPPPPLPQVPVGPKVLIVTPLQNVWYDDVVNLKAAFDVFQTPIDFASLHAGEATYHSASLPAGSPAPAPLAVPLSVEDVHAGDYLAVIFIGQRTDDFVPGAPGGPQVQRLLAEAKSGGVQLASICVGVRVLGSHGVLEGRSAATAPAIDSEVRREPGWPERVQWRTAPQGNVVRFPWEGTTVATAGTPHDAAELVLAIMKQYVDDRRTPDGVRRQLKEHAGRFLQGLPRPARERVVRDRAAERAP